MLGRTSPCRRSRIRTAKAVGAGARPIRIHHADACANSHNQKGRIQLMFRFKTLHLLSLGLLAPVYAYAADYCISVNGGFGGASGGATYVGSNFTVPAAGACVPWSG